MAEFETLFALAEISVALAGFSAIVVIFKRREDGSWHRADSDRFHGMVLHAMAAAFFCLLPALIAVFTGDTGVVWKIASGALGAQVLGHAAIIARLPTTRRLDVVVALLPGLVVVVLQAMNVLGIRFAGEFGPYLAGVVWHVFQAGVLFVALIWVRAADIGDA